VSKGSGLIQPNFLTQFRTVPNTDTIARTQRGIEINDTVATRNLILSVPMEHRQPLVSLAHGEITLGDLLRRITQVFDGQPSDLLLR